MPDRFIYCQPHTSDHVEDFNHAFIKNMDIRAEDIKEKLLNALMIGPLNELESRIEAVANEIIQMIKERS